MNKWVVDETILDGASYELLEDIVAVTGRASKKSFKGRAAWKCKSAAAAAFQSLCLEDRLLVGELLMALALESHSFRSHSSAVVGGLQTLARMRNVEFSRLSRGDSSAPVGEGEVKLSDRARRLALNKKYECIREAIGTFKRTPIGTDRDGREYYFLGEQWSPIFVCEREMMAVEPDEPDESDEPEAVNGGNPAEAEAAGAAAAATAAAVTVAVDADSIDDEVDGATLRPAADDAAMASESATLQAVDSAEMENSDKMSATKRSRMELTAARKKLFLGQKSPKKKVKQKPKPVRTGAEDTRSWVAIGTPEDLQALLDSLAPADEEELRLKSILKGLQPRIVQSMSLSTNPADGILGSFCTSCFAQPENLLLCDGDGTAEVECTEEWCFVCAKVSKLPEGDWSCSTCAANLGPSC